MFRCSSHPGSFRRGPRRTSVVDKGGLIVRSIVRVLSGFLLAWVPWAAATAQAGSIRGTVSDSAGNRLGSASVSVEGTGLKATTAASGEYEVRSVSPGTYTVRVRLMGFVPGRCRTVPAGDVVHQDVTLAKEHGPARADRRGRRLPRPAHRGGGAGGAGGRLPGGAARSSRAAPRPASSCSRSSPSINFPRQSVTDAGDIVRPFTLRGLSPDHTLVLVNGWRRHQTALVNNFTYGMGAGSSGVDLNAIPSSALDRIEVLRDGAAAQYGSDAIAGVVNLVLKDGAFTPVRERRRRPLRHRRLPGRRHHGERERRLGHRHRARLAGPLRRVPRPPADQPRVGRSVRGRGHRGHRLHRRHRPGHPQAQPGRRSRITTGATGWRRTCSPSPTSGCR